MHMDRWSIPPPLRHDARLRRCLDFVESEPDDFARRRRLKPADVTALHERAAENDELWPLYRRVSDFQQADTLYHSGRFPGTSITQIRKTLSWRGTRTEETAEGRLDQTMIARYWPMWQMGHEILETSNLTAHRLVIYPLVEHLQTAEGARRLLRAIEREAPSLLQRFPGNEAVKDIAFGRGTGGVSYTIVISHPDGRVLAKQPFPLIDRYKPLMYEIARDRRAREQVLETSPFKPQSRRRESPSYYYTEEWAELMAALYQAALGYNERATTGALGTHLRKSIEYGLGDAFDTRSSTVKDRRTLDSVRDAEGGSLDDEDSDATKGITAAACGAWTTAVRDAEGQARLDELRQVVREILRQQQDGDPLAARALELHLAGWSQQQMAKELAVSQPTVSRALRRALDSIPRSPR